MDRGKLFDEYFRECCVEGHEQFCGQGEKNSDILIVGKESTQVTVAGNHALCEREKGCGQTRLVEERINTWDNYQKLVDLIYEGHKASAPKEEWDLEHFVFAYWFCTFYFNKDVQIFLPIFN